MTECKTLKPATCAACGKPIMSMTVTIGNFILPSKQLIDNADKVHLCQHCERAGLIWAAIEAEREREFIKAVDGDSGGTLQGSWVFEMSIDNHKVRLEAPTKEGLLDLVREWYRDGGTFGPPV